jgi:hypothetical protein
MEDTMFTDTEDLLKTTMLDEDEIKRIRKESRLNGTFVTVPPIKVTKTEVVEPGVVLVKMQADVVNETDKGRVFFSIINKNVPGFDGKPGLKSQLYLAAIETYAKAYGSKPSNMDDLVKYVTEYPITVRVNNGFVVNIRQVGG